MNNFSQAEIDLFKTLGFDSCLEMEPITAYRVAATLAFEKNLQGKPVDALRKGFAAFSSGTPYRLTREWDAMISFQESDIREMADIIASINNYRDSYNNPGSYQEDSWYLRCDAKSEALSDVLVFFNES